MEDKIESLNSRNECKSKLDIVEEGMSELKDRTGEIIQNAA